MSDEQPFADLLAIETVDDHVQCQTTDQHANAGGSVHGGLIATLVDMAMGRAVREVLEHPPALLGRRRPKVLLPVHLFGQCADMGPLLQLAKAQLDAGDRDAAIATLQSVQGTEPGLAAVVQQRLARLLIDAGRGEEALTLLADARDAVTLEARGDAHFALEQLVQARDDYTAALRHLDSAAPQRGLLELKLSEVGGTPDAPEVES